MAKLKPDEMLTVTLSSPEKLVWQGKALSVSSRNVKGRFDILPKHANFITIVENEPLIITTATQELKYEFNKFVIYTHNNYVSCYAL